MPVSMSGSWNISGSVAMDPVAPFSVSPGPTSSLLALQNQPIVNFNPLTATGGYAPYTYFVSSGVIPPGLTLNSTTGVVSGTPTTVQNTASVVFAVRDSSGNQSGTTATVNFAVQTLPVSAIPGTTTSVSTLLNSSITSFSPFSSVSNGFGPYTYFVSSGTLPTGITINASTGLVSGTPTVVGAATVVFAVRDSQNNQSPTTATVNFSVTGANYTIQYLVVGGGGGGGYGGGYVGSNFAQQGGGGGGGGVRTGCFSVTAGTTYPITVGDGGAGGSGSPSTSSVFAGNPSVFSSITSSGGGSGGLGGGVAGGPGGSGGGAGAIGNPGTSGGAGGGGSGQPGQGFAGGNTPAATGGASNGAGGGGATAVGSPGTAPAGSSPIGGGGNGYAWPLTGPTIYGAGGGGGSGTGPGAGTVRPGGNGGASGGNGATNGAGSAGTANRGTGGGGGGAPFGAISYQNGGAGGSGVVILAVPTPHYPGAYAPRATTPAFAPGMTVITFTAPGTYTA